MTTTVRKNISRWSVYVLLILTLQMLGLPVDAQIAGDSQTVTMRRFDKKQLEGFKKNSDFQYRMVAEPPASLWERFWSWFWSQFNRMMSTESGRTTFKVIIYSLAILLLLMFVLQIRKMNAAGMFGSARSGNIGYNISEEDIHGINFKEEIMRALEGGEYRLAVRLHYLQSLKILSDNNLIDWRIDKTNISYVKELQEQPLRDRFKYITSYFENHWYGNIPVAKEEFATIAEKFDSFNRDLKA